VVESVPTAGDDIVVVEGVLVGDKPGHKEQDEDLVFEALNLMVSVHRPGRNPVPENSTLWSFGPNTAQIAESHSSVPVIIVSGSSLHPRVTYLLLLDLGECGIHFDDRGAVV
jgi:hypothetical protein